MMMGAYKVTFAARLKEARKRTGYTQADIEQQLGIAKSSVSQYENGKLEPSIDTIGTLAAFYNVSTDWLFGLGRPGGLSANPQDIETSKQLEREAKRQRKAEKYIGIFGDVKGGIQHIGESVINKG